MRESIEIVDADFNNPSHGDAIVVLVDAYARDPMGGAAPLREEVRRALLPALQAHPTALAALAFAGPQPVGVAVGFIGFSTFAARPLLNIHDLAVLPTHRRRGVGRRLLTHLEAKARALGCCKLTLEVREDNGGAQRLYRDVGFADEGTPTRFWTKRL